MNRKIYDDRDSGYLVFMNFNKFNTVYFSIDGTKKTKLYFFKMAENLQSNMVENFKQFGFYFYLKVHRDRTT